MSASSWTETHDVQKELGEYIIFCRSGMSCMVMSLLHSWYSLFLDDKLNRQSYFDS
jgi:hypothetical protein